MAVLEKVDVVIVGAGMSGAIFAAVLSRAGKKVAVLEQGRDWNLTDLVSNEIWGRRIKAINPAILEGKEPVGYGYNSGWGMGGAGLHFFGSFPRMLPSDLNMKSEHGHGFDWPISYEELEWSSWPRSYPRTRGSFSTPQRTSIPKGCQTPAVQ